MEISESISQVKEDFKNFNIQKFNWREFVKNSSGIPSAGLFIAFWFGITLLFLFIPITLFLLIAHRVNALVSSDLINNLLLFIGTQISVVLTYLSVHKATDNSTLKINKDKPDTSSDVNLKTTEIK